MSSRNPTPLPNPNLLDFSAFERPASSTAALVYDTALGVPDGTTRHCLAGNLQYAVDESRSLPFLSRYGTSPEAAAAKVRLHAAALRAEAARLEARLAAMGGGEFVERMKAAQHVPARVAGGQATLGQCINEVAADATHLLVNGVLLARRATGGGFERVA